MTTIVDIDCAEGVRASMESPDGDRYFPLRGMATPHADALTDSLGAWHDTIVSLRREVSGMQGRYRCAAAQPDLSAGSGPVTGLSARDLAVRMGALGRLQDALASAEGAWRHLKRQSEPFREDTRTARSPRPTIVVPGSSGEDEVR